MKADGPGGAVVVTSQWVALAHGIPDGLVSLGVGLVGVALARWVFVNREVRRTSRREGWKETLPLTLVAMLITSVIVIDRSLSVSASAFLGLGVGWAAVLILDILGERVLAGLRGVLSAGPASSSFPKVADVSGHDGKVTGELIEPTKGMAESLKKLDQPPPSV